MASKVTITDLYAFEAGLADGRAAKRRAWTVALAVFSLAIATLAAGASRAPVARFDAVVTPPTLAVFIGDSYTAGAGASTGHSFPALIADQQGWVLVNLGRGGTGYLSPIRGPLARRACGLIYCPSYTQMIPAAVAAGPDVVVVNGGRNQLPRADNVRVFRVAEFFVALRVALPDARIIATSPIWDDGPAPAELTEMCVRVRQAVTAVGGVYVDLGEPLYGHPELVAADGVHPNDAGHAAIAAAFTVEG